MCIAILFLQSNLRYGHFLLIYSGTSGRYRIERSVVRHGAKIVHIRDGCACCGHAQQEDLKRYDGESKYYVPIEATCLLYDNANVARAGVVTGTHFITAMDR